MKPADPEAGHRGAKKLFKKRICTNYIPQAAKTQKGLFVLCKKNKTGI